VGVDQRGGYAPFAIGLVFLDQLDVGEVDVVGEFDSEDLFACCAFVDVHRGVAEKYAGQFEVVEHV